MQLDSPAKKENTGSYKGGIMNQDLRQAFDDANINLREGRCGTASLPYDIVTSDMEDRPDLLLARDRSEGTIRDNWSARFHQSLPIQEPTEDSWLDAKSLKVRVVESIADGRDCVGISDYIERLPSTDLLEEICQSVGLTLGLSIDFEDRASPGADKRDLVFWWE